MTNTLNHTKQILWWGRSDLTYSRNAIMIRVLKHLGWESVFFHPHISPLADIETLRLTSVRPLAVWVPCFRQRDFFAARRFARRKGVPIIFDPLISSYDKRVFEFKKLPEGGWRAQRLKRKESSIFRHADLLIADTSEHKLFFEKQLDARPGRCVVIPVGADPKVFTPQPFHEPGTPPEAFFYGSFLPLHGVETILKAAQICPKIQWTLLGGDALRQACEQQSSTIPNLRLENPIPYNALPARIGKADVILGVFGTTPKAGRVIPNKVFQALACGRPVVTRTSAAYPDKAVRPNNGLTFIPPGNPEALAAAVHELSSSPEKLHYEGQQAIKTLEENFSFECITDQLRAALARTGL